MRNTFILLLLLNHKTMYQEMFLAYLKYVDRIMARAGGGRPGAVSTATHVEVHDRAPPPRMSLMTTHSTIVSPPLG